mgnify:CR=1 FL=1
MFWYLGETRYIYAVVTASSAITITSATCAVYLLTEGSTDVVTSISTGNAAISGNISAAVTLGYLFTPSASGNYLGIFSYVIGSETYESRQIINIRETI